MFAELVHDAAGAAWTLLAVPAGLLPRRLWARLDALPIGRMAGVSALATLAAGVGIGIRGFLRFSGAASDGIAGAILQAAGRQAAAPPGGDTMSMLPAMMTSGLSPLAFLVATPAGWLAAYLAVSGTVRVLAAWTADPLGDPLLGGLDFLAVSGRAGLRGRRDRRERERREGPEEPDRLYVAGWAGVADADLVVVSSRRKPDWATGTFVITSEGWYRLGASFELELAEGLRTVYPLTKHVLGEVLRRSVAYELPPLRQAACAPEPPGARTGR